MITKNKLCVKCVSFIFFFFTKKKKAMLQRTLTLSYFGVLDAVDG